jgi:hypothetical protein
MRKVVSRRAEFLMADLSLVIKDLNDSGKISNTFKKLNYSKFSDYDKKFIVNIFVSSIYQINLVRDVITFIESINDEGIRKEVLGRFKRLQDRPNRNATTYSSEASEA